MCYNFENNTLPSWNATLFTLKQQVVKTALLPTTYVVSNFVRMEWRLRSGNWIAGRVTIYNGVMRSGQCR